MYAFIENGEITRINIQFPAVVNGVSFPPAPRKPTHEPMAWFRLWETNPLTTPFVSGSLGRNT